MVSKQKNNNSDCQFDMLEENLRALQARVPDLPFTEILLCRLLVHMGREMATFSQPDGVAHPSDLCARAAQSPANMSRISDALVSRDLITRVPSAQDRRRMVLRITEQGEDLVRRLLPKLFVPLRGLWAEFSESEQRLLISQLRRLYANLDEADRQMLQEQAS
jgi:MarR family transcriptional repressor of emrRAB